VTTPSIVLRSVTKTYRRGERRISALQDVSFEMSQGELALLVGPSGSGKTTLLNLIAALDRPDAVKSSSAELKSRACHALQQRCTAISRLGSFSNLTTCYRSSQLLKISFYRCSRRGGQIAAARGSCSTPSA
jgi:ABC-type lipoprotein export system ATPase subunit